MMNEMCEMRSEYYRSSLVTDVGEASPQGLKTMFGNGEAGSVRTQVSAPVSLYHTITACGKCSFICIKVDAKKLFLLNFHC